MVFSSTMLDKEDEGKAEKVGLCQERQHCGDEMFILIIE